MTQSTKKMAKWLALSLILMLLGSAFAAAMNSNMGNVDVSEITFETERGTMSAYLYKPEGSSAENPRPTIVLTHGYLNSKEMQDATAVEMSRRGYNVLVVDQYDHGLSRWSADIPVGTEMGTFFVFSMIDAVTYAYNMDITLKDADGNGYIGCSGHSMGGLSTVLSIYFDEMQSLQSGHRMIYAAIPVSADFSFTDNVVPTKDILAAYGDRTIGIVSGHYDEFFFGDTEGVYYKDYINHSTTGPMFLGLKDGEKGKSSTFYDVESGDVVVNGQVVRESQVGKHIVYEVDEAHAMNHFSTTTEGHIIDFFQTAFEGVTQGVATAYMTSTNQVWWLKEVGNLIALVGFFMFFAPFVGLITKVGIFKKAVTEETAPIMPPTDTKGKIGMVVFSVIFAILPAVLYIPLMQNRDKYTNVIHGIGIVAIVFAVVMLIVGLMNRNKNKSYSKGGFVSACISVIMAIFMFGYKFFDLSPFFNQTTTNWTVFWSLTIAFFVAIAGVITYYFINKPSGVDLKSYGFKVGGSTVVSSFLTAVAAFVCGYAILFIIHTIFKVDFRFWTVAVKIFSVESFITMLKYVPFFFFFYLAICVVINSITRGMKYSKLVSVCMTASGILLWFIVQYGTLYVTGVAAWPTEGMIAIAMLATIPMMIVATIFTRKLYDKTNNVWTASFLNALLFTMIPVANTLVYWNLVK